MNDKTDKIITVDLEPIKVISRKAFGDEYASLNQQTQIEMIYEPMLRAHILHIETMIAAREAKQWDIKYPLTWWDAVKMRFFPKWLLDCYPAQERHILIRADELYPTIALPYLKHGLRLSCLVDGIEPEPGEGEEP